MNQELLLALTLDSCLPTPLSIVSPSLCTHTHFAPTRQQSDSPSPLRSLRLPSSIGGTFDGQTPTILPNRPSSSQSPPSPKPKPIIITIPSQSPIPSKILLPRRRNPGPKNRTLNLHIHLIERTHNRLNPILIDLSEELLDRLFCLWGGGVCSY